MMVLPFILIGIGILHVAIPEEILGLFAWWYSLFGMKVDRNHPFWSTRMARFFGICCIVCGFGWFLVIQSA